MEAELEKLEANLGGVADMKRQPDAVFIVDLKKEQLAVREAQRLGAAGDRARRHELRPGRGRLRRSRATTTRSARATSSCGSIADGIAAGRTKVTAAEMARAGRSDEPAPKSPPLRRSAAAEQEPAEAASRGARARAGGGRRREVSRE